MGTQGGNDCLCLDGFYRANLTHPGDCENKNECNNALDFTCQANSECRDTHGSYACDCNDGFVAGFDITGNAVCNDVDECKGEVSCPENSSCRNNFGSWGCACDIGYENDPDSEECVSTTDCGSEIDTCNGDFDECKDELDNCHDNAKCTNTPGSFECECEGEYSGDGETCIICPSLECWTFDAGTNTCTPKDECSTLE